MIRGTAVKESVVSGTKEGDREVQIRNIGIVGARSLSPKYADRIGGIIDYLVQQGFHIATGGAMGTDQFVLEHLIERRYFERSVVFSAWNNLKAFPVKVRRYIAFYEQHGGAVKWGASSGAENPIAIKGALLFRNRMLVDASHGLVAFLTEQSRGTFFTVKAAIDQRRKLVLFPIHRELPNFKVVKWVPMACGGIWDGAYRAVYLR